MASPQNIEALVSQLSSITRASFEDDDNARATILAEAQKLVRRLEDPYEAIVRMTFNEPTLLCALLIADHMRLFPALGPVGSPTQSVPKLAEPLNAEPDLIKRVMRHLAASQVVAEYPGDVYGPTELSALLANPDNCVGFREAANRYVPIFAAAPSWLQEHGYQCPRDAGDAVFQKAFGKKGQTFWDWLQMPEHKHASDEFGRLMRLGVQGAQSWLDVVSVDDKLKEWDGESAILVDVGGSLGQDARQFRRRNPAFKGDLVVQDLPATIALAEKERFPDMEGIVMQPHDFFKEQPVKGAKMYFMGSILHDWPDVDAKKILHNLAAAMKKDYSTLFLSEIVLPEVNCHPRLSAIDICMLVELGAMERSEKQWEELLASEGLTLVKVHRIPTFTKGVIEAKLA